MVIYPLVLPVPPPLKGVGGTRALAHSIKNHLKQNPERVKSSSIATGKLAIQFEYMIIYAPVVFFREIGDAWRRQRNVPEGLLSNKC